jgi:hypothetical protein
MAKTHGGSTPAKSVVPKSPADGTLRLPTEKKRIFVGSMSDQLATDQPADDKKGGTDKEVPVDPSDIDKKLCLSMELDPK